MKYAMPSLYVCARIEQGDTRGAVKVANNDGTLMAIFDIQGVYYIGFRATRPNRMKDWIRNLSARRDWKGAHKGFWRHYKAVNDDLAKWLDTRRKIQPIVFCGHSLGGGAAVHGAELAALKRKNIAALITFGQPRIANRAFFDKWWWGTFPYVRFVNGGDIVPHLPFAFLGYTHYGDCVKVGNAHRPILDHEIYRYAKGMRER